MRKLQDELREADVKALSSYKTAPIQDSYESKREILSLEMQNS